MEEAYSPDIKERKGESGEYIASSMIKKRRLCTSGSDESALISLTGIQPPSIILFIFISINLEINKEEINKRRED